MVLARGARPDSALRTSILSVLTLDTSRVGARTLVVASIVPPLTAVPVIVVPVIVVPFTVAAFTVPTLTAVAVTPADVTDPTFA